MPRPPLRLWSNLLSTAYFLLNHLLIVNGSSPSSGPASSAAASQTARESSSSPISATPATKSSGLHDQVPAASEPLGSPVLSGPSVVSANVSPSTAQSKAGALPSISSAAEPSPMSTSRPAPSPPPPKTVSSKNDTPVVPTSTPTPNSSKPSTETSSKPASSSSHANPSSVSTKGDTASVTRPGPPSTRPVQAPPTSSSHSTSTTTSVVIVKPTTSAKTSTVTMPPDTTLSKPLAITTTGPNGAELVTTPPLVTITSTSTEADGGVATFTHVVANPNFNSSQQLVSATGIHKPGVLAGVCIVAGVVLASILVGIVFCFRRQQRIRRRQRWLAGMQQQRPLSPPNDPFRDPPSSSYRAPAPEMRTVNATQDDLGWNGSNNSHSSPMPHEPMTHEGRNVYSLYPDPYPIYNPAHATAMQGTAFQHVGPGAYPGDLAIPAPPFKRHSLTPSTPSIYPVTLPPDEEDHHEAEDNLSPQEPVSPKPPPRPPRSHLRESAKIREYAPLTPPDSASSSQPPSPISESRPQDIFTRRTLLDVRFV